MSWVSTPGGAHFELTTAVDLFHKAERDLERFRRAPSADDLFDFFCTLNHLPDWIENDNTIPPAVRQAVQTIKGDPKANPPVRGDPNVELVRKLCNRAKHFRRRASDPKTRSVQVAPWFKAKLQRPFRTHPWSGGPIYEVNVDGSWQDVVPLGEAALSAWEAFLRTHRLLS